MFIYAYFLIHPLSTYCFMEITTNMLQQKKMKFKRNVVIVICMYVLMYQN